MPAVNEKSDKYLRKPMGYPTPKTTKPKGTTLRSWNLLKLQKQAGQGCVSPR